MSGSFKAFFQFMSTRKWMVAENRGSCPRPQPETATVSRRTVVIVRRN